MKVIYVGGNHAGTLSMKELKARHPETQVVLYEENTVTSFLACGIALSVGGVVEKPEDLFYSSPEDLRDNDGVEVHTSHKVTRIDKENKKVFGTNLETNEEFEDTYDKLVLATGSWPIIPPIPGVDANNIHLSKTYQQAVNLIELVNDEKIQNVTIVGAGYIGMEQVEAFNKKGKNVTLIDFTDRILQKYYEEEFSAPMQEELNKAGVTTLLNQKVVEFSTDNNGNCNIVKTDKGEEISTDLVIMSVGFRPYANFLDGIVELAPNGAVITDDYRYTSDENILAIGDGATIRNNTNGQSDAYVALASNAIRTGVAAALNIYKKEFKFTGVQGANGLSIYDYNLVSVGYTEEAAKNVFKMNVSSAYIQDKVRPEFMPHNEDVQIRVCFDLDSGRIIGAQIGSREDIHLAIHFFSLAIQEGKTVNDLVLSDLFFLPHYNKPINYILKVLLKASSILESK